MPRSPLRPCRNPTCPTRIPGYGYCQRCATRLTRACNVTLVAGPPCAGKNTHIAEHARPGDLIVDFDAIVTAIGGAGAHDQPEHLKPFAFDARDAILERIFSGRHELTAAWIILSAPDADERDTYRRRGCKVVLLDPGRDICHQRATLARPAQWASYIDNWYDRYTPDDAYAPA